MGLCLGSFAPSAYTYDELKQEISQGMVRLPLANQMNENIIRVEGKQGYFNARPLLDEKWLKGRLSMEEYQAIVDAVNEGTIQAMVGQPKFFSPSDIPKRLQISADGAQSAVDALNQQWNPRNVYLTFSMGELQTNLIGLQGYKHQRATFQHSADTFLYIRID